MDTAIKTKTKKHIYSWQLQNVARPFVDETKFQDGGQSMERKKKRKDKKKKKSKYLQVPRWVGTKLLLVAITGIYGLGLVFKPSPSSGKSSHKPG